MKPIRSSDCETMLPMPLARLAEGTAARVMKGDPGVAIYGVTHDSRCVTRGDLFVCLVGESFDGHSFISEAIGRGASAVMGSDDEALSLAGGPAVFSPDPRADMALMSHKLWDHPSRKLRLVGVTGTNGKSTTVHLLESIFSACGHKVGIIGTLGASIAGEPRRLSHTTPESCEIARLLAEMVDREVWGAAMEVSSHGIAQDRPKGCEFDVAVFSNLTQDHLDYHGDLRSYFETKKRLFVELPRESDKAFHAVINADDPYGAELARLSLGEVITFGQRHGRVSARAVDSDAKGTRFTLETPWGTVKIESALLGDYNLSNCLAAAGVAGALGIELGAIAEGIARLRSVPGRLEPVDLGQPFQVLVDYAHTPGALENALGAARCITAGRVIVVFGCGGDRDKAKRPIMGGIGAAGSDLCILTSDNPRSEDPEAIVEEIMAGADGSAAEAVRKIVDRREAIQFAVAAAEPNDTVLIAGKGHEDYQVSKDKTIHFDDREIAAEAIKEWLSSEPQT